MQRKILLFLSLIGCIWFFGLAFYGYFIETKKFVGSDEDLRSGFLLGGLLLGSNAIVFWLRKKKFILFALLAPLWAPLVASFFPLGYLGSVGFGLPELGGIKDRLLWPWAMLLFPILVMISHLFEIISELVSSSLTVIFFLLMSFPAVGAYIYGYIFLLRMFKKNSAV